MKRFEDLQFDPFLDGIRAQQLYPNGYGVSVIRHGGSYGGDRGLYELAVLKGAELCFDTPVTDDVLGWLTPENVSALMREVQELPDA